MSQFWRIFPEITFVNCIFLAAPTWLIFSGLIELAKLQMKTYQKFQNFTTRWMVPLIFCVCLDYGRTFPSIAELISQRNKYQKLQRKYWCSIDVFLALQNQEPKGTIELKLLTQHYIFLLYYSIKFAILLYHRAL